MRFSELGSYNIFANSYEATESKTRASKRFVVGESCSLTDILEIELLPETSASFKVGESGYSTFGLKDSSNFSSINWKATLPSGQVIENEDGVDTLEVDLSSESNGLLVIEVSAISSDVSKSGCLAYRRKEVIVTSNIRPYFNPINFTDGRDSIPVVLENDIYMYEKPEMLFLQIEVLNADSCEYQINEESEIDFNCDSELIEVLSNLGTDCINGVVTLFASKSQGEVHSQSYYHYCPADGNYCYFGPVTERPSLHVCSACPSGQYNSSSGCNAANPSNSTCQSRGNGCYGWSCNSGYTQSGNSCTRSCPSNQYNSQTACDGANPTNSTCNSQGNGCYGWSCDSGYTQSGNSCVRTQGPSCGTSRNTCNPGTPNDEVILDTTSRYKWRCSHNGQNIDTCFSCKSGYQKSGNSCTRSCPSGQYTSSSGCNTANPSNSTCSSQSNGCYGWSCDSGYTQSGNSCTRSCPSGQYNSSSGCNTANPSNSTCQSRGNGCYSWSCDSGYTQSGNSCVRSCPSGQYTSSSGCNTANPSNSTCSSQSNGCYSWSCDSGYTQSGNSCVQAISITHLRTPSRVGKIVENCQSNSKYNACIFTDYHDPINNYGVNILDTINTFLENNSYKVLVDGLQRATLVSGKWTRPYNSDDPNRKTSQANLYHWLMYQKEWMELNASTWYASNKNIKAKIEDIQSLGAWYASQNKMAFNKNPRVDNLILAVFHEAGHANLSYAKGGIYIRSLNYKACSKDGGPTGSCCNTYKGCLLAINEGQAEFSAYLIDTRTIKSPLYLKGLYCKSNITLTSTATEIYNNCDKVYPKGQRHAMGMFVYTTLWKQIYDHPNINKKYIAVLFSEHLPLLEANDDFVTAGVKIVSLANQLFDESTGTKYAEIIRTIFKDRGLPLVCPSDKVEPHYKAVGNQCLPSCGHACNLSSAAGICAGGNPCNDTANYNITQLTTSYQLPCCKRTPKDGGGGVR